MRDVTDKIFEVGDTVRLKSGGPAMTVTRAGAHNVETLWFNSSRIPQTYMFAIEIIEHCEGETTWKCPNQGPNENASG